MNIVLWILQVLLAVLFGWHGWLFLAPPPELVEIMNAEFAPWFRIFLGVAEWLAAAGLILPGVTRIMPWLTALAAAGLMIVMSARHRCSPVPGRNRECNLGGGSVWAGHVCGLYALESKTYFTAKNSPGDFG